MGDREPFLRKFWGKEEAMKVQEEAVYREIQRNAESAIKAIETVWDKVYDTDLSMQMSRQSLKYDQLKGQAMQALLDGKGELYRGNYFTDLKLKAEMQYNTLLNTSTGHIAELMIKERNKGMLELEKVLRHNKDAGEKPRALAEEFIAFQQKSISNLKDYL